MAPDSGNIILDQMVIVFSGMEPVLVDLDDDPDITEFNINNNPDEFRLMDTGTSIDGNIVLESLNGTFENTTFPSPSILLKINALGGTDTITIEKLDDTFNANLTINAGDGNDDITVNAVKFLCL